VWNAAHRLALAVKSKNARSALDPEVACASRIEVELDDLQGRK